jgi:carboxylate-amine ligase
VPAEHPYGLFERTGVELEYMIVDAATLDVLPVADRLLRAAAGSWVSDAAMGPVTWSNEMGLHVVELKTTEPAAELGSWAGTFQEHVRRMDAILSDGPAMGGRPGRLLPAGMHPWMDPWTQMRLWPHEGGRYYEAFDAIFDCRGHGWANLQSVHVNLPFRDDAEPGGEFGRCGCSCRSCRRCRPVRR